MNNDLRTAYSRSEMIQMARNWVNKTYRDQQPDGKTTVEENQKAHEQLGALVDFITEIFPTT